MTIIKGLMIFFDKPCRKLDNNLNRSEGALLPGIEEYYLARKPSELAGKDEANIAMLARAYRGEPQPQKKNDSK
jgi:hypothetical protein